MSYLDGFVIAVPTANKDQFVAHARKVDAVFIEQGATRVVECWGADVKKGHTTDFQGAVQAGDDETIAFSWIEWPDKVTRDAAMARIMSPDFADDRADPAKNPMPFDGKRMIYGGFQPIVERGERPGGGYVQGFMIPVPEDKRDDYRRMAEDAWPMFSEFGATGLVEAWGDDVPVGQLTDFYRGVKAEPGEKIVFSFMTWPSREVAEAAHEKMQSDERMDMPEGFEMPFDGKRMVWGGFEPVVELEKSDG